jgi:hypothetical protein
MTEEEISAWRTVVFGDGTKEYGPVTDWPNVETDMDAWRDWARNGKPRNGK